MHGIFKKYWAYNTFPHTNSLKQYSPKVCHCQVLTFCGMSKNVQSHVGNHQKKMFWVSCSTEQHSIWYSALYIILFCSATTTQGTSLSANPLYFCRSTQQIEAMKKGRKQNTCHQGRGQGAPLQKHKVSIGQWYIPRGEFQNPCNIIEEVRMKWSKCCSPWGGRETHLMTVWCPCLGHGESFISWKLFFSGKKTEILSDSKRGH